MSMEDTYKIQRVFHKETHEEIALERVSIRNLVHPSSNTKKPLWRVFVGEECVRRNNPYLVHYECPSCRRVNIVALNNMVRKMNHNIYMCNGCKNQEPEKVARQREYMRQHGEDIRQGLRVKPIVANAAPPKTLLPKLKADEATFQHMDGEFQHAYFRKHLTREEFERIASRIVSFQHGKFTQLDHFVYYPCVRVANQTMFHPYMYDTQRDMLEKLQYIAYRCDGCHCTFVNRDLHVQKNRWKLLCQTCTFTNDTFKLRQIKNCRGANLLYQSKLEKKFVEALNEAGVEVVNGPRVVYEWNGSPHTYRVDFMIPQLDMVLELKGEHHWHKQQVANGKWAAKEEAAIKYCADHGYTYHLVFSKNYMQCIRNILKRANKI